MEEIWINTGMESIENSNGMHKGEFETDPRQTRFLTTTPTNPA